MRCKPGDLAVIINDDLNENIGMVVNVICMTNKDDYGELFYGEEWEVVALRYPIRCLSSDDGSVVSLNDGEPFAMFDKNLRPIRDQEGKDETLTWACRPKEMIRP